MTILFSNTSLPDEDERRRFRQHCASRAISWLKVSRFGAEILYHRGFLLFDRLADDALEVEATTYYLAWLQGYAELKQRHLGAGDYAYLATRSDKRMTEAREELFRIKLEKLYARVPIPDTQSESSKQRSIANRARIAERSSARSVVRRILQKAAADATGGARADAEDATSGAGELGE